MECHFHNLIKLAYQKLPADVMLDEILASCSIRSGKETRVPAIGSTTQSHTGCVAEERERERGRQKPEGENQRGSNNYKSAIISNGMLIRIARYCRDAG